MGDTIFFVFGEDQRAFVGKPRVEERRKAVKRGGGRNKGWHYVPSDAQQSVFEAPKTPILS